MVCRVVRMTARGTSWGDVGRASTMPTAQNLAVFPWTQECDRCQMRIHVRWATFRATTSTLFWEIPAFVALGVPDRPGLETIMSNLLFNHGIFGLEGGRVIFHFDVQGGDASF